MTERKTGIDALRILAMFMIVTMHLLKQGGVLYALDASSSGYGILWLLEVICFCAVNCYALISGYVGSSSRFRLSKLVLFWLQIFFYTMIITGIFAVLRPETVNIQSWWKALFPVLSNQYWYMTCYFGLFLLLPFLNQAIEKIEEKQFTVLVGLLVIFFSVGPCILEGYPFNFPGGRNVFGVADGYSVIWLLILYLIGAYIRKNKLDERVKAWKAVVVLVFCVLLTWGCILYLPEITLHRFGESRYAMNLLRYTSPTMLVTAVCFCLLFAKIQWKGKLLNKGVFFLSGTSLGVYLIHTHPLIWDYYIKDCTLYLAGENGAFIVAKLMLLAITVYLVCTIIEALRKTLFRLLKLDKICQKILSKINFN